MCVYHQDRTALHWCAKKNFIEGVTALLEAKAQVNLQNQSGKTALHYCAEKGHTEGVTALLEAKTCSGGFNIKDHFANAVDGPYEELAQKCYDHNMANEMDEALPYSEALVRMDPANAMHHYHLARNYLLLNQLVNALFHYNWVICCP